jgi:TLC domain
MVTTMAFVTLLVVLEQIGRSLISSWVLSPSSEAPQVLMDITNQQILARHVFVDTIACLIVSVWGYQAKEALRPVLENRLFAKNSPQDSRKEWMSRFYEYMPAGYRVSLFFVAYQIKNLYDTIVWDDGPEYVFHHVFAIFTALGALQGPCGHLYTIFFFGLSEISTAVLCMLANFDDQQGVPGLGDAYPLPKVILGAIFVVLFIICRVILWPVFSYYFVVDCCALLKDGKKSRAQTWWLRFFVVSNTALSILQVGFLSQILIIGKQELTKMKWIE